MRDTTEEDDLLKELKKLPGNRPCEDRETKESDLKVRSLLNYPEVQRAFVELAKCYGNNASLTDQFNNIRKQLSDSESKLNSLQRERDDLKAEVARLNSLLPKKDGEDKAKADAAEE